MIHKKSNNKITKICYNDFKPLIGSDTTGHGKKKSERRGVKQMAKAKLHLIGNAHLDPVWLWRWQEGYSEVLATFRSALDRMKEFPDFTFSSACAVYYMWVEESDPAMFEEIQQRVREGRWEIVGGWLLQPDCNIPSGESFARHGLISQRYFQEKFGLRAKTGYNVDSFGHNASLPMILSQSGMKNYVFMRPSPQENEKLSDAFMWESADGSRVCTYRIPVRYNIDLRTTDVLDDLRARCDEDGMPRMAFCGVGNHGGGPTIRFLEKVEEKGLHDTQFTTVQSYFDQVNRDALPVIREELQHHAVGCYSACSAVKANNRACEENLLLAEKFSVLANQLTGATYPREELQHAWKNLLFHQFHDILGGCSIESAYRDAGYSFGEVMNITERLIHRAMQQISGRIDTLRNETLPAHKEPQTWRAWSHETLGMPVVVFNPHAWRVRSAVQISASAVKVTDEQDRDVPFQIVRGEQTNRADKYCTLFLTDLEPFGYAVYRVFCQEEKRVSVPETSLRVTEYSLENGNIRVELDQTTGEIARIYDKKEGRYILERPCTSVLLDETDCDTWAHRRSDLGETVASFRDPVFTIKEQGPARGVIRVRSFAEHSSLTRDYRLLAEGEAVEVAVEVEFHEKHRALKFTFPLAEEEAVTAEIPYGTVTRHTRKQEEPFGHWLATGRFGVATDSKYGYDTDEDSVRITVLRGAIYADHYAGEYRDEDCHYMDQGTHRFSYTVFPYRGKSHAHRLAAELNCPTRSLTTGFHHGTLPEHQSCFACDDPAVLVTAMKQREDGQGVLLRLLETEGKDRDIRLQWFDKEYTCLLPHNGAVTLSDRGESMNFIEDVL